MKKLLWFLPLLLILTSLFTLPVQAIEPPAQNSNNKVGIHIISPAESEIKEAATLVNSTGGDWGYVTLVIERDDKDLGKWQKVFDLLRKHHLIPLLRIATEPKDAYWERPRETEAQNWADFLDKLNWPTKNRYVIVYNEPNHAQEWGNTVDATSYAKELDTTITALKAKSPDFFVLNGGLDLSAPQKLPAYQDAASYYSEMNQAVPGIFNKLDGWSSHSYPNPEFSGSPLSSGRISIKGYLWEMDYLRSLGLNKNLPIFITETGWKHAEGTTVNPRLLSVEKVSEYYKTAFERVWTDPNIVAVTPFLLNYPQAPFDHFSFKKATPTNSSSQVLGTEYPDFHPQYKTIKDLPKVSGKPTQETKALLVKGTVYQTMIGGHTYPISLTFKNTGQSIWGENGEVTLRPLSGGKELKILNVVLPKDQRIEPNQDYTFNLNITAPDSGTYPVSFSLFQGNTQFQSEPVNFQTTVKSEVIIKVKSALQWKDNPAGEYLLKIVGILGETNSNINLSENGQSEMLGSNYLLPDYEFDFTLIRPFYKPKTIHQKVQEGVNELDFGTLQPDISSAILNPPQLWKLLPFSR